MRADLDALSRDLIEIAELLRKYQHPAQQELLKRLSPHLRHPTQITFDCAESMCV